MFVELDHKALGLTKTVFEKHNLLKEPQTLGDLKNMLITKIYFCNTQT